MPVSRQIVIAKAIELFGEEQAEAALDLVDQYGIEVYEREVERVKLAILDLSEGKLARLPYFVMCAKIDYRDVLTGAKLEPMTAAQEGKWQEEADRRLAAWKKKS